MLAWFLPTLALDTTALCAGRAGARGTARVVRFPLLFIVTQHSCSTWGGGSCEVSMMELSAATLLGHC